MNRFALILTGTLLAGALAFAQPSPTTTTTTSTTNLPPAGIGAMETLQIILTNTASSSVSSLASPAAPSCTGSVAFYNASGTQIGSPSSFMLGSNQITSVNLSYASAGSTAVRALVRPVISITTTRPNPSPCALSYSVVAFNASAGVTTAVLGQGTINGVGILPIRFGDFTH
ncbi:MAG: hypothetical protein KGN84_10185 [Acidobacteriota bacterium]|nr:hypothetical protein [Acidobacteriota bacterium]